MASCPPSCSFVTGGRRRTRPGPGRLDARASVSTTTGAARPRPWPTGSPRRGIDGPARGLLARCSGARRPRPSSSRRRPTAYRSSTDDRLGECAVRVVDRARSSAELAKEDLWRMVQDQPSRGALPGRRRVPRRVDGADAVPGAAMPCGARRRGREGARRRRGLGGRSRTATSSRRSWPTPPGPTSTSSSGSWWTRSVSVVRYTAAAAVPAAQQRQRGGPRRARPPAACRGGDARRRTPATEAARVAPPRSGRVRLFVCPCTTSTRRNGSSPAPSDRPDSGRSSSRPERARGWPACRCEKEQVQILADRVNDVLDQFAAARPCESTRPEDNDPLATPIEDEFRVGTMSLAWDADRAVVVIEAFDADIPEATEDDEDGGRPTCREFLESMASAAVGPGGARARPGPLLRPPRARPSCRPAGHPARSAADRSTRPGTSARGPTGTSAERMDGPRSAAEVELVVEALTHGDLDVVGQITDSSNIALLCEVPGRGRRGGSSHRCSGRRDLQADSRRAAALGLSGRDPGRS